MTPARRLAALALAVAVGAAASGCAADDSLGTSHDDCTARRTTLAVNLRSGPGTRFASVVPGGAKLDAGDVVALVDDTVTASEPADTYQGGWRHVRTGAKWGAIDGWAADDYLEPVCLGERPIADACGEGQALLGYVRGTYPTLNLRTTATIPPGDGHYFDNVIDLLPEGAPLHLLAESTSLDGDWLAVEVADPSTPGGVERGYVAAGFVARAPSCRPWGLARLARFAYPWGRASYASYSTTARIANMAAAAARLDGRTVARGAELSYLALVVEAAQRSYAGWTGGACPVDLVLDENGRCNLFREGHSTAGGIIFGGGVCGTSSALHRAAMVAGLPIYEWHPHSRWWSLYGYKGEDAQVAWGDARQDYRVLNDTGGDLFLVTSSHVAPTTHMLELTVELWGTTPVDRSVAIERPCRNADGSNAASCAATGAYTVSRTVERADGTTRTGSSGEIALQTITAADGRPAERWVFTSWY